MTTIPASYNVRVNPSVLQTTGNALALNGVCLSNSPRVPIGAVMAFNGVAAVKAFFGSTSKEAIIAGGGLTAAGNPAGKGYFGGFNGATITPGTLFFTQYNQTPVPAYLRGGNISALTLAQLQAIIGSLNVTIDGYPRNAASVDLSTATSFSSGAGIIQTALNAADPTEATFTASFGASFTGSGSGTNLTTTAVTGFISPGDPVAGTGVPANTKIVSQTSGPAGGAGVYVTNNATTSSSNALTTTSSVLDVTVLGSGTLSAGQTVAGSGVTGTPIITGQISGTAGQAGRYSTNAAPQSVASEAMTSIGTALVVSYDSQSGAYVVQSGITGIASTAAFATGTASGPLALTQAAGAVVSQGAAAAVQSTFMDGVAQATMNWASFFKANDPDKAAFIGTVAGTALTVNSVSSTTQIAIGQSLSGANVPNGTTITAGAGTAWTLSNSFNLATPQSFFSGSGGGANGNTQKLAFSAWASANAPRFVYIGFDSDITPTQSVPASSSFGYIVENTDNFSGTFPIYEPQFLNHAAFVSGSVASIDFTAEGGRVDFAFLTQDGLAAAVTSNQIALNLGGDPESEGGSFGNSYNFVGAFGTANQGFVNLQRGSISGSYQWLNSYVNQIALTNALQLAAYVYMTQVKSFPYTTAGYSNFEIALQSTITQFLNFGAYAPSPLDSSQVAAVNQAAGANIATTLQTQGWYLQIKPVSSTVKKNRGSPPITFWYIDQGDVQALNIGSVSVA